MLAELTIEPLGQSSHVSSPIAQVIKVIADSGLDYQVTAMGTLFEGEPELVWDVIRRCHTLARNHCERVMTEVRIDDRRDGAASLHRSVRRIEDVLGTSVRASA
jgi:uncharacterized protein (TIGR00106 family)